MKSALALLCTIALAVNTALAGAGDWLLCLHEDGAEHTVSQASSGASDDCCHEDGRPCAPAGSSSDCGSCVDIAIEATAAEDASPPPPRDSVKAPALLVCAFLFRAWIAPALPEVVDLSVRFPHPPLSGAAQEYTATVQLRC